jgi:hypothetical protein
VGLVLLPVLLSIIGPIAWESVASDPLYLEAAPSALADPTPPKLEEQVLCKGESVQQDGCVVVVSENAQTKVEDIVCENGGPVVVENKMVL